MQINEKVLRQIASNVCRMMAGRELTPVDLELEQANSIVASIEIAGSRRRTVELRANEELAAMMAEAMFGADRASLSLEEIRDAFGEVTNMIGGNVKAHFGEEAQLSLPVIRTSAEWIDGSLDRGVRATLQCDGRQLTIVLRENQTSRESVEAMLCESTSQT